MKRTWISAGVLAACALLANNAFAQDQEPAVPPEDPFPESDEQASDETADAPAEADEPNADDGSFELPVFGQTTFTMTSTTTLRYRGQNYDSNAYDDDFFSGQQRFDFALQGDELRAELRLDGFLPTAAFDGRTCPSGQQHNCYLQGDVRPERMTLRWEHESWNIELGDAQVVLGRGIALSFRKVDLLGVDNALRGGHIRLDDGHFRARLHVGMANPQNQDPITLGVLPEPEDMIAVGAIGVTFGPDDAYVFGLHGGRIWFMDDAGSANQQRAIEMAGWTLEAPSLAAGSLALYLEANAMRRTETVLNLGTSTQFGRAVYASAQYTDGSFTLLLEWKDYRNFLIAPSLTEANAWRIYSAAPNAEFVGPQRLRAIGNQRGAALRADFAFLPGPWSFSANGTVFGLAEEAEIDPWAGVLVKHGWLTLTRRQEYGESITWSVDFQGGYRHENLLRANGPLTSGAFDRELTHVQAELTIGSGEHSFDISADHRWEDARLGTTDDFERFEIGGVALTYSLNVQLTLSLNLRWSNQNAAVVTSRAARAYNFLGGVYFPSIEARWNFDPGTFLRLFFGSTPGGRICSGGVCRDVPPFEGALLQLVGRL